MKPSLTRCLALAIALALPLSAAAAQRIVSIGGDVTEIAFALGAGDEVIARDSTSLHPEAVKKLPDVGYMRQLNAEGILALKPTLVLTTELAQPALVLRQLEESGVKVVSVPGDTTLQAVPKKSPRSPKRCSARNRASGSAPAISSSWRRSTPARCRSRCCLS